MRCGECLALLRAQQSGGDAGTDQVRRVAAREQARMMRGVLQHHRLEQELDVDEPPRALFQVERVRVGTIAFGAPARAHRDDLCAKIGLRVRLRGSIDAEWRGQAMLARGRELARQRDIPRNSARAHQCLTFPDPRASGLVRDECVEARHQQPGAAIGAQAHVDLVQAPGTQRRGQQVHDALREPRVVARAVERSRAVRLALAERRVVHEHEIEIRREAEFPRAETAVGDDREAATVVRAPIDVAMRRDDVALGDAQHRVEHGFGDLGQRARRAGRVDASAEKREADAEQGGQAFLLDGFDLGFRVRSGQDRNASCDRGADRDRVELRGIAAIVEQLVEQQRVARDLRGEERARGEHFGQAPQRGGLFREQGQVHRAARDGLDQVEQAREGRQRVVSRCGGGQQRGHQVIEPFARTRRHRAQCGTVEQAGQCRRGRVRIGKAMLGQHPRIDPVIRESPPRVRPDRPRTRPARALARRHECGEFLHDDRTMRVERLLQACAVHVAERERDAFARIGFGRKFVGLAIREHLHPVLDLAQEAIRLAEPACARRRDQAELLAHRERRQQAGRAQRRFAPTADHLRELHDEFDLADPAGAELEVVGKILARDLRIDECLHFAQARERAVVEVAAENERTQRVEQLRRTAAIARDRARLDPRVAFPVATLALVIAFHRRERRHQRARVAERAQAQVDAIREPVGADFAEQCDDVACDPREPCLGVERPRTVAAAVACMREDEIDVRREVQLAATELAEREHDEALHRALRVAQHAVARCDRTFGMRERGFDAGRGEHRGTGQDRVDRIDAVNVAPDQAQRFALAEAAQFRAHRILGPGRGEPARARVGMTRVAHQAHEFGPEQERITLEGFVREIAGQQHARQVIVDAGVVVERHALLAAARFETGHAPVQQGGKFAWQRHGDRHADQITAWMARKIPLPMPGHIPTLRESPGPVERSLLRSSRVAEEPSAASCALRRSRRHAKASAASCALRWSQGRDAAEAGRRWFMQSARRHGIVAPLP